eukprot:12160505-Karenia_brevis.AAC.1
MSSAARALLEQAAAARAREEPLALQASAARRRYLRWVTMLVVAAQNSYASSLEDKSALESQDGSVPVGVEVWLDAM